MTDVIIQPESVNSKSIQIWLDAKVGGLTSEEIGVKHGLASVSVRRHVRKIEALASYGDVIRSQLQEATLAMSGKALSTVNKSMDSGQEHIALNAAQGHLRGSGVYVHRDRRQDRVDHVIREPESPEATRERILKLEAKRRLQAIEDESTPTSAEGEACIDMTSRKNPISESGLLDSVDVVSEPYEPIDGDNYDEWGNVIED